MATLTTTDQLLGQKKIANTGYGDLYVRIYGRYNNYSSSDGTVNVTTTLSLYLSNGTMYSNGCNWGIDGKTGSGNLSMSAGQIGLISSTYNVSTNSDGSSKGYTSTATYDIYGASGSFSVSFNTPTIPRYANLTSLSIQSATETSITLRYTTDKSAWLFARINDGDWLNGGNPFVSNTTSGTFTIKYKDRENTKTLDSNTTYKITVLCRAINKDSGIDTSKQINGSTYDYPHVTSVNTSNLIIGNKQKLTLYNPLSRNITIKMNKDSTGGTQFYSGTTSSTSIEFTPTASTLYASIPSAKSGKCVYSVIYSGVTKTTSQYTYSINENNCKPTFSNFTYADIDSSVTALTSNNQILVDNNSDCKFTISTSNKAVAKNSASITKYKFEWGSKSSEATYSASADVTITISNSSGNTLKITAIDSRGLSTTISKTITNISYINAVVNEVTATRSNGVESKTYLSGKFTIWNGNWQNGSNTDYDNQLKYIGYRVYDGSNWTSYFDITDKVKSAMSNYSSSNYTTITLPVSAKLEIHANGSGGGFTIGKSYTIQVLIKDGNSSNIFTPSSYQATLQGSVTDGKVGMSRYKDSDGNYHYGINGMPSSDCAVTVKGNIKADGDVNLISRANAVNINGHKGILRHWTNDTQICANDGVIYLRPKGNENATNQVAINNDGSVSANKFNGQVTTSTGGSYRKARDNATVLNNGYGQSAGNSFNVVASQKTSLGAWSIGNLSGYEDLIFSYNTDTNYKNHSNTCSVVKLPITGGTIQCEPTILYNNSTGTTGTVTLSDSAANYSYLEIFIKNNDNYYQNVKVTDPNNKNVSLTVNTQVGEVVYLKNKTILISGKSISNVSNYYSQVQINASLQLGYSKSNLLYIVKVLGYK